MIETLMLLTALTVVPTPTNAIPQYPKVTGQGVYTAIRNGGALPCFACIGDCDRNVVVSADEVSLCADIAQDPRLYKTRCGYGSSQNWINLCDANRDGTIDINDITCATRSRIDGCHLELIPPR